MTMIDPPSPSFVDDVSIPFMDKDGNLIGEILFKDAQGNPAFIFRGYHDISFEALNKQTGTIATVMGTGTSSGNTPTLFAPFRVVSPHIETDYIDATAFRLGSGFNLEGIGSDFIVAKDGTRYLRIGSDRGGLFLQSDAVYYRTTSTNANVAIMDNDQTLRRSTSARKYKADIKKSDINPYLLLEIEPKSWIDKAEQIEGKVQRRYYGLIADDVDAVGLGDYVTYDNGEVDALMYDRLWTLLIPIVKDLKEENDQLRKNLENTNKVASDALVRVEKLEEQLNENN